MKGTEVSGNQRKIRVPHPESQRDGWGAWLSHGLVSTGHWPSLDLALCLGLAVLRTEGPDPSFIWWVLFSASASEW